MTLRLLPALALSVSVAAQAPPPQTQLPRIQSLPLTGRPATGSVQAVEAPSANGTNASIQIQGAFQGSRATGTSGTTPLALTLEDAIQRGLRQNLGAISAADAVRQARAQRQAALAQLLPDVDGSIRETVEQINLAAQGLRINVPIPGFHFPTIVGPFNYFDARAALTESVSLTGVRNLRSSQENEKSASLSIKDARDLVTLAVAGSYLQIAASDSRIQTANAQLQTAQVVYQQATDRNRSGLNARIDRSLVELQTQQQRITSLTNDLAKQKIALARLIGLPMAQIFNLADTIPYREIPAPDVDQSIQAALGSRADVQAAAAQVRAAEQSRKAATSEYLPSVAMSSDYGAIGVNPAQSHGTFSVSGGVQFPIFRSGRIRSDIEGADAALSQRRAEYADARGRAEQDVRDSVLDLTAAAQLVRVAQSNRELAADALDQARDRFRAGVSDTVEVIQAQEAVAAAEQDYISAGFAFSLARVSLARATGDIAAAVPSLVTGK